ncbi:hypothetical protein RJ640_027802 [Escallonia rubra]|uniref:Uncharacterized protein n=1 Tax=Escallonia rubra TaxID=112253 RepID=A0AA88QCH5_9ASTE|nr:hypothetical protein RJ640_027802 [Escallonia rubra]
MEKAQAEKQGRAAKGNKQQRPVWDCGSSLYDSFELKSFERQLDSAITSSRTLSMPHLSNRQPRPPPQQPQSPPKKSSKISRSPQKLLRSVFRPKQQSNTAVFRMQERLQEGFLWSTTCPVAGYPRYPRHRRLRSSTTFFRQK